MVLQESSQTKSSLRTNIAGKLAACASGRTQAAQSEMATPADEGWRSGVRGCGDKGCMIVCRIKHSVNAADTIATPSRARSSAASYPPRTPGRLCTPSLCSLKSHKKTFNSNLLVVSYVAVFNVVSSPSTQALSHRLIVVKEVDIPRPLPIRPHKLRIARRSYKTPLACLPSSYTGCNTHSPPSYSPPACSEY